MTLLQLFLSFLQIGLFSFGGGYAALPLIQQQVVDLHGWLTLTEFTDVVTLSQMTPGPVAINAASFVGARLAGPLGAVVATLSCILAPCIIVFSITLLYQRFQKLGVIQGVMAGLRPAAVALIFSAGVTVFLAAVQDTASVVDWQAFRPALVVLMVAVGLVLMKRFKVKPLYIMLGCGLIGGLLFR